MSLARSVQRQLFEVVAKAPHIRLVDLLLTSNTSKCASSREFLEKPPPHNLAGMKFYSSPRQGHLPFIQGKLCAGGPTGLKLWQRATTALCETPSTFFVNDVLFEILENFNKNYFWPNFYMNEWISFLLSLLSTAARVFACQGNRMCDVRCGRRRRCVEDKERTERTAEMPQRVRRTPDDPTIIWRPHNRNWQKILHWHASWTEKLLQSCHFSLHDWRRRV